MKTKKYIMIMSILILIFITLMSQGNIGVSKYNMEKDARKSQKIQEDWLTAKYINDDFGAFLFYSKDLSEYTFSIYQNRSGFSFGYFFYSGGSVSKISDDIVQFNSNDQGSIFLSLNKMNVSKIEIDNGLQEVEHIPIEPNKPFTVIIPKDSGEIRFYDVKASLISYERIVGVQL
ncbi:MULTISPECIES: hypothetical protein [Clostridium]|uniref:Uncharacterized protein n=2 Tax=Clostridium TaxID=1485 RepID=A0A650MI26_9CLOT|nr:MULTISPECIES: hypothetical protein [Clostridium]MBP8315706.1 hypothetical protein [Clostridium neonatale]MDU4479016.1 hypothetical protein [Clostridium sp.]CAG9706863.1 conserved hypothetical protein [Clostridium neonatale]CAI3194311.1 conserved hypothetical protein [Clostridium neonatale]CAI3199569.1 conserved hypothetical protein [Clostridium neonatale]